jgi:hypothetical protein
MIILGRISLLLLLMFIKGLEASNVNDILLYNSQVKSNNVNVLVCGTRVLPRYMD